MKLFLLYAIILCVIYVRGQKVDHSLSVPASIKNAFSIRFTNTEVNWNEVDSGKFRAEFIHDGKPTSLTYDEEGKIYSSAQKVSTNELPAGIVKQIGKMAGNYTITSCTLSALRAQEIKYEVFVKNSSDSAYLFFDADKCCYLAKRSSR